MKIEKSMNATLHCDPDSTRSRPTLTPHYRVTILTRADWLRRSGDVHAHLVTSDLDPVTCAARDPS
jgi:hypothetical protein